ncbi:hypothetical protein J7U46_22330 [Pelomonas sp. V22]|uniref:hypothetical protein n=1 Tax=Pelomonas sp. V22 TaxID=2822139 RepID=UPI0024A9AF8E|nr:hypothetical protein [Pelomonas sp. V22]MDI4635820.1 hypothetical protein [Pelomonas sp. V22]
MHSQRYTRAIERNLAELQRAILNRTTMVGIEKVGGVSSLFLQVTYFALFNDYVAHCIKVFENSTRAASFWYIYRTDQGLVDAFAKKAKLDIASLEAVSAKLKHIRDQTHFHIDSKGVLDTKSVWRAAGLTGKQLSAAVDAAWSILTHLQQSLLLPETPLPAYYKVAHVLERVACIESGTFKS